MVQCIGIIGGNGVIGYKLATLLANHQNMDVIITSRQLQPQHELPPHVTFTTVHLEREDEIISLIRRCDLIINCTGRQSDNYYDIVSHITRTISMLLETFSGQTMKRNCIAS